MSSSYAEWYKSTLRMKVSYYFALHMPPNLRFVAIEIRLALRNYYNKISTGAIPLKLHKRLEMFLR